MNSIWIPIIIIGAVGFLCVLLPFLLVWRSQIQRYQQERTELAERYGFTVKRGNWNTISLYGNYRNFPIVIKNYQASWPYTKRFKLQFELTIKNPQTVKMRAFFGEGDSCDFLPLLVQEQNNFYGKMRLCGEPKSFLLDFIFSSQVKKGIKKAIGRTYKIMGQVSLVLEGDQLIFEQLERSLWSSNESYIQYMMDWLVDCAEKLDEVMAS